MQSEVKDGGPAFPFITHGGVHEHRYCDPGMSLRDWFAGQAIIGLLQAHPNADCGPKGFASDAYLYADAMLAAREEGGADHA